LDNQEHNELDVTQEKVPAEIIDSELYIDLSRIVERVGRKDETREQMPLDTVWDEEFFKSIGLDLP
jgi:hypothetical protein